MRCPEGGARCSCHSLRLPPWQGQVRLGRIRARRPSPWTFRLRLSLEGDGLRDVRAQVIDGDRDLRLSVDPALRLVVRGLLGEPLLRFSRRGVWVNGHSPTAAADRLVAVSSGRPQWLRLTPAHSFMWHDHRLAPPVGLREGASVPWSLPVLLNGRAKVITGSFTRVAPPLLWPWLVGAAGLLCTVAALSRTAPRWRTDAAAVLAGLAAAGALAASAAFATGDAITRTGRWFEVGSAAALALFAAGSLLIRDRSARAWAACLVGAIAAALTLGSLEVFLHGVVISSLPAFAARLATAVAVVGGAAAAVLAVLADEEEAPGTRARPRPKVAGR